jgi:hypothetical protein
VSKVRVRRCPQNGKDREERTHKRANLNIDEGNFDLSGPRFGFVARGVVLFVGLAYSGADYDIHLEVLVQDGWGKRETFHRENMFVTFLEPGKDNLS